MKDLTNKLDKLLSSTFKSSNSRVNPILIQGCETGISFMEPYSFIHFRYIKCASVFTVNLQFREN